MDSVATTPACLYLDNLDTLDTSSLLCSIKFGSPNSSFELVDGIPTLAIPSARAGLGTFLEAWSSGGRRGSGEHAGLLYAYGDEFLFCAGRLTQSRRYTEQTFTSYSAAFELADSLGFETPVRMWNYISSINADNCEGLEIYRDFCRGRARAFDVSGKQMPAATGVGADGEGITFYLLCSRSSAIHLENPVQTPAYHYPDRYGPRSPSFARATMVEDGFPGGIPRRTLYISGTASIVGHDTVHEGDVVRQCDVTFDNIRRLITSENFARHGVDYGLTINDVRCAKVYVRRADDVQIVKSKCETAFGVGTDIRYLNLDICREDLLVEVEAIA